jgi:hypothetical protein
MWLLAATVACFGSPVAPAYEPVGRTHLVVAPDPPIIQFSAARTSYDDDTKDVSFSLERCGETLLKV